MKLFLVCATQVSKDLFPRATLLGRSLQAFPNALRPSLALLPANTGEAAEGLSAFYNRAIDQLPHDSCLLFVHDDVYLHDWHLGFRLQEAFRAFDVVGLVGSCKVPYGQPGWWHGLGQNGNPIRNDAIERSGSINHFDPGFVRPDVYGPAPLACDLLDGVFLAARKQKLVESGVRFDPQFRFHCYDTDFCYSARRAGLTLGTWPIAVTHGSGGAFGPSWIEAAKRLQKKLQALPEILSVC